MEAAIEHQSLEHVAGSVRPADAADHTRAALARADEHEVALAGAAALDGGARTAPEQGLAHQEAPSLLEDGHQRLVESAGGPPAHRAWSTNVSSATGSASSRSVSGSSTARTSGGMPFVPIVLPPGR